MVNEFEDVVAGLSDMAELGSTICPRCHKPVPNFSPGGWRLHFGSYMCQANAVDDVAVVIMNVDPEDDDGA